VRRSRERWTAAAGDESFKVLGILWGWTRR
jgi:hypothetical protein